MKRFIDADVLMESLKRWRDEWSPVNNGHIAIDEVIKNVEKIPTVDAVPVRHGKWLDREVVDDRKDAKIQQWQQARCSCCNKWHTTPYMYYFENYDYCPHCGAKMDAERREE